MFWPIGPRSAAAADARDAQDLCRKPRVDVAPTFITNREWCTDIMRKTIACNASFFNTHRMVQQYQANAYV